MPDDISTLGAAIGAVLGVIGAVATAVRFISASDAKVAAKGERAIADLRQEMQDADKLLSASIADVDRQQTAYRHELQNTMQTTLIEMRRESTAALAATENRLTAALNRVEDKVLAAVSKTVAG